MIRVENDHAQNLSVSVKTSWVKAVWDQEVQYGMQTLLTNPVTSILKADTKKL